MSEPTDQGVTMTPLEEGFRKVLETSWVAKSRAGNRLTIKEIDAMIPELLAVVPEIGEITAVETDQWFGVDRQNDKLYRSTKKAPVLAQWLADMEIDKDSVTTFRRAEGVYYYSYPRNVDRTEELWLVRRDKLEEQGISIPDVS